MKPRDYQNDAVDALWEFFVTRVGNPLVLMPTGTGKSIVLGAFIRRMFLAYPGARAMMATHVETLIEQNFDKLLKLWPTAPAGINSAGLNRRDTTTPIVFGGVQSMFRDATAFGHIDILFVDEAHLVSPKEAGMYMQLIEGLLLINPRLKVVGLTATGWRTDNGPLVDGGMFTDVAIDMTTTAAWNYFVDAGYLSPLYSKRTKFHMDAEGVGKVGADYNMGQLQRHVDKEAVSRQAVEEMLWWGETRRKWMVFATGINHCEHVADILCEYGIDAVAIHSKSKKPAELIEAYAAGEYRAAVTMNKLTTGVDVPDIDLIGVMRHTLSSSLWVQMLGRGTRPVYAPGYDLDSYEGRLAAIAAGSKAHGCLVLDFARNTENLGPVNDPVVPQRKKKGRNGGGAAPVKACPVCLEYCSASARFCYRCGHEFITKVYMDGVASELDVMVRGDRPPDPDPVVEEMEVVNVTYNVHRKKNKPNSLRVSYFCKSGGNLPRMFSEYICLEHMGKARSRAETWWRDRCVDTEPPVDVTRAMELSDRLRIPKRVRIWTNAKHPEVTSYEY